MAEEEDFGSLTVPKLKAKCKELGLDHKNGIRNDFIRRLNDYYENVNAPDSQTPRLSDIDEVGESESDRSTTPRRKTRGRSDESDTSRRLSGLSTRSRTRSSSRPRRDSVGGRRRSFSATKTPRTPINDVLNGIVDPYERSPQPQRDQIIELRLANVEGKQQSTDDRFSEVTKNQIDLAQEVGCLKEFRDHTKSKIDKLENKEKLVIDIEQCFIKHVNETRASFAKMKSDHEVEIGSIKSENVKTSETITKEINSLQGEVASSIEKLSKDVKGTVQKVERLDKDVNEIWIPIKPLIEDNVLMKKDISVGKTEQSKLVSDLASVKKDISAVKLEQSKLECDLSKLKSQNRCLLLISIGLGLLLVATTDFFPFDALLPLKQY